MKSILISINPQHALNILNGSKTLELRKSVPKDFIGWVYMYITLGKKHEALIDFSTFAFVKYNSRFHFVNLKNSTPLLQFRPVLNGKVVARWWFDGYRKLQYEDYIGDYIYGNMQLYEMKTFISNLCLTYDEIKDYGNEKDLYAWHINKLEIFDKPMWLSEFISHKIVENVCGSEEKWYQDTTDYFIIKNKGLTRPSQSWQYVWVKE